MGNNAKNFCALIVDADTTVNANANGGIDTGINGGYGINVRKGAKLTINGGYYYGGGTAVQVQEGELTINGGIFAVEAFGEPYGYNFLLNCVDTAYKNKTAKIIVKGGIFKNFNPADNTAEGEHTNFVADGYKVVSETKDNGEVWYTVVSATAKVDTITADENGTIAASDVTSAIAGVFENDDGTTTGVEVTLPAGSIKLKGETASAVENVVKGKNVTFVGNGADTVYENLPVDGATGEGNADYSLQGAASVTFKNMTINLGAKDYDGFVRAGNLYFENCKIIGRGSYWGVGEVVFKNCEFTAPDADYCITLYSGKSFTFENCTFNSAAGKFINAYVEQFEGEANVVNLTNCVFNAGKANKAAICLKSYKNAIWKVTFTNCNVEQCKADGDTDDLPTGSKYYSVRNETGTVPAGTTVTVDGTVVWANGAKA